MLWLIPAVSFGFAVAVFYERVISRRRRAFSRRRRRCSSRSSVLRPARCRRSLCHDGPTAGRSSSGYYARRGRDLSARSREVDLDRDRGAAAQIARPREPLPSLVLEDRECRRGALPRGRTRASTRSRPRLAGSPTPRLRSRSSRPAPSSKARPDTPALLARCDRRGRGSGAQRSFFLPSLFWQPCRPSGPEPAVSCTLKT